MPGIDWLLRLQAKYDSLTGAADAAEKLDASTQRVKESAAQLETKWREMVADSALINVTDGAAAAFEHLSAELDSVGYAFAQTDIGSKDLASSFSELTENGTILEKSAVKLSHQEEKNARATERSAKAQKSAADGAKTHESAISRLASAFNRAQNPVEGLTKKLTRMALSFFTVRKLVRYLVDAVARAPDEIGSSLTALKTQISDGFARITVSALAGMQKSIDRLQKALNSPGGQRFFRGLETAARLAGEAIGMLIDRVSILVEWIGNHFPEAIVIATVALSPFIAKMIAASAATLAANWPLLLIAGSVLLLIKILNAFGISTETVLTRVAQVAGGIYAFCHNLIVDAWNVIASFAEFFANVFDNPLRAVKRLFFDVFYSILGVVETAANAIDALFDSELSSKVSGFRNKLQSWADEKYGKNRITIALMEKIDTKATALTWGDTASSFTIPSLDALTPQAIKQDTSGIKSDTSAIRKSVNMAEEDLKSLVDYATRSFVAQFNLQHLAPQITVNGQNTGNTVADAEAIAETIKQMLIEQTASGTYIATARP